MRLLFGCLLWLACIGWQAQAHAQSSLTGFVYQDDNGNGVRDAGERGIAGVKVSNGRDLVISDGQRPLPPA